MRFSYIVPFLLLPVVVPAQDRLPSHPRAKAYQEAQSAIPRINALLSRFNVNGWSADSKFAILRDNKAFDLAKGEVVDYTAPANPPRTAPRFQRQRPDRGRQYATQISPDEKWIATYKDANVYLSSAEKRDEMVAVTTEGSDAKRIKFGTASWVYGEELNQIEAMWFSPDSKKLIFYKIDDSKVIDYYLTTSQNAVQNKLYTEAYPKAGAPNPTAELYVYDLASKETKRIDTTLASSDADIAHYVYGLSFQPGTNTLLFHRTNRKQNVMEWLAADLDTGKTRIVYQESNPYGWVENHVNVRWLGDNKRFIMTSERSGYANLYVGTADQGLGRAITKHSFDVSGIARLDEAKQEIWYTTFGESNSTKTQLHRIKFDGGGHVLLTDATLSHTVNIAPDGSAFADRAEALGIPPIVTLRDRNGKLIKELGRTTETETSADGYKSAIRFAAVAADGKTPIFGYYNLPKNFNPNKKYPVILAQYGGPGSGAGRERFIGPDAECEYDLITAWVDGRGTDGRGRDFRQSVYGKLGVVEVDDTAAAMKAFAKLPFVDGTRIGIEGTSYGGYFSVMAILRHPDVFSAACASSSVTAWYHYDTIYTERYMDTPQNNPEGYKAGSAMEYAKNLKGALCLFYGTADDNVHPSNTHQLISALDRANKPYRLYVGVDQGHAGVRNDRKLEFFFDAFKMW
ncbi:MAG TPA: DPP IV N-terminal domain-containing protein [Fimbriimonas sp.]|nr:DPP IV N-terminal domain-containing protein [Fimbriimonas sp.]